MDSLKGHYLSDQEAKSTSAKKRRLRRKKLQEARTLKSIQTEHKMLQNYKSTSNTSSVEKSKGEVIAAREAKKLAKHKSKQKEKKANYIVNPPNNVNQKSSSKMNVTSESDSTKSKDELDRALAPTENITLDIHKSKDAIKAQRPATETAKPAQKQPDIETKLNKVNTSNDSKHNSSNDSNVLKELTVVGVENTLKEIISVAKDFEAVTNKVLALELDSRKSEPETSKSKAQLKAERRAKQEAQRAAKQVAQIAQQPKAEVKTEVKAESNKILSKSKQEKPNSKAVKPKPKIRTRRKTNWFSHLDPDHVIDLKKIHSADSKLHPAVVKLGIQMAERELVGCSAQCIAVMDATIKMVRSYALPELSELPRALEPALAAAAHWLRCCRAPGAALNALWHVRRYLTDLPRDIDEHEAKNNIIGEIKRYIHEQIVKAEEAISIAVLKKICDGDRILTYGCSLLVERILVRAHAAGVRFHVVVTGARGSGAGAVAGAGQEGGAADLLRRLCARGLRCSYADMSAISNIIKHVDKVVVGCAALTLTGATLAAVGSMSAALCARAHNVPLLVACETHKFIDLVQTNAFTYNQLGTPDDLIIKSGKRSPLKNWRSNPSLELLNVTYDLTPATLVTAVATELALLPCSSAPFVVALQNARIKYVK